MTTVLVCDDRRGVREGLARAIAGAEGVRRVEAVDPAELLARYSHQPVDVVIVGLGAGASSCVDVTRWLLAVHHQAMVLVCGTSEDTASIAAAIAGGARGYLSWRPDLAGALAYTLATAVRVPTPARGPRGLSTRLSGRELQVLRGISEGKTNSEIGRELHLAEDTVKAHTRRLFHKLGVHDRAAAVAHAFRRGLMN